MAVGFPRTNMSRGSGGTFRVFYDLDLGNHEALLLLNFIDQKVSQKAIPDLRGGDYTMTWEVWFVVVGGTGNF